MKRIIIMLICVNTVHAMQYDQYDDWNMQQNKKTGYILGASYFIMHRLNSCEKYWVNFDPNTISQCPEHTPALTGDQCDIKLCEELQKGAVVVTFYDRNDNPIYENADEENHEKRLVQTSHYGHIGSLAVKEQCSKLDPQSKPIAAYATVSGPTLTEIKPLLRRFDEWCCPYISFFDDKDRFIFKMPIEGYRGGEQLSQTEKADVLKYVALAECFSIKDKRDKKGCCGCCVLV